MRDATHVQTEIVKGALMARLKGPALSEYEAGVVHGDIAPDLAGAKHRLAIDFAAIEMLASAGIGMIIRLHRDCAANKGRLVVFNLSENILDVLKMTKLTGLFTIAGDREAALKKLS